MQFSIALNNGKSQNTYKTVDRFLSTCPNFFSSLENWDVVVYLGSVSLCNALCYPHNVSALLLLQADIGVENSKVELLHEGEHVDLHLREEDMHRSQRVDENEGSHLSYLPLKKPVLQCLLPGVIPCPGKDAGIFLGGKRSEGE